MRFLRISTSSFGGLRDLDTGPDPLPGLVVVRGRNEAGKSTFFELLSTALYGFYPASRETHPYAPWDGGVAEAHGVLGLEDGSEREVQRRLLSSPQGTLVAGETSEDLRNRTLPFVEHVPRPVYNHVFALTLEELSGLGGESWEAVQDRLMGGMGATDLRSARDAADELETEAGSLWKTHRRGSQHVRELEERVRDLRLRRQEAAAEEAEIRGLSVELADARERLARAREAREACRLYIERHSRLLPIRDQLVRIEDLRRQAGDPALLEDLPTRPGARLAELRQAAAKLEERAEELEEATAEPRQVSEAFAERDQQLLKRRDEVEALVAADAALKPVHVRVSQLDQELRDLDRRIGAATRRLLDRDADEALRNGLSRVSPDRLREAVETRAGVLETLDALTAPGGDEPAPPAQEPPLWFPLGPLAAGLLALLASPVVGSSVLPVIGAVLVGVGLVLGFLWFRARSERRARESHRETREAERARRIRELHEQLGDLRDGIDEILAPVDPGPDAPDPDADFPARLEALLEAVRDEADRRRSLEEEGRRITEVEARGEALRDLLPDEDRRAPGSALAHLLSRSLRTAEARRDAAAGALRELSRIQSELDRIREDHVGTTTRLARLEERLRELGDGDLDAGIDAAERRIAALDRARQLTEELERAHPRLAEYRTRIREAERSGEEWVVDPEALSRRRAREATLSDEIEEGLQKVEATEKDLERLGERTTLDELDGEILEKEEQIRDLVRQRDRLWVLARIIREAERRIREDHQPAILRESGRRLAGLTGGRYDRLLLAGRDGRSFQVRGPAAPTPLAIEPPLSSGTREQIYLALRLTIVDQLDRAGERLPLLLDEVLVNWDPERRDAGLDLVAALAEERQIFFFTCHPAMADRLETRGARRIELDGP